MTPLPQLPTDNLYKFLALTGVALVIFALYSAQLRVDRVVELQSETDRAVALAEIEAEEYEAVASKFDKQPKPADKGYVEIRGQRLIAKKALAEARTAAESSKRALKKAERAAKESQFLALLGFLLMALGFSAWYLLVQQPLDMLLAKQLLDAGLPLPFMYRAVPKSKPKSPPGNSAEVDRNSPTQGGVLP